MNGRATMGWTLLMLLLCCGSVRGQDAAPGLPSGGPLKNPLTIPRLTNQPPEIARTPSATNRAGAKSEPLAIIVNTNNPTENITFEELRKLCLGERKHWSSGRKVTIVLREPGHPERDAIMRQVFQLSETEFTRHFLQGSFTGELQAAPKELGSANGVRRFVFNVPGAIGFVPVSEVNDAVKVLRLEGRSCNDPDYKLRVPATATN